MACALEVPAQDLLCIQTVLTPCSLEFCPKNPALGVCGLYQTDQQQQKDQNQDNDSPAFTRSGAIILFDTLPHYHQVQSIDCPAILDQQWTQDVDNPMLLTIDAQADLNAYQLTHHGDEDTAQLEFVQTVSCRQPSGTSLLGLSIDISDRKYSSPRPRVLGSLSNGHLVLFDTHPDTHQLVEAHTWLGHTFEPWTCAFDYWQPDTLLSGGDDCQLKVWDSRSTLLTPVITNKLFEGGVTAIRSHHLREHIFGVGSYDGGLRIFDKRQFKEPMLQYKAGGGIWRIKWHPSEGDKVLLATMHDGSKVVEISDSGLDGSSASMLVAGVGVEKGSEAGKMEGRLLAHCTVQSGLAYGADWGPMLQRGGHLIGTCSFYDRVMHFWHI